MRAATLRAVLGAFALCSAGFGQEPPAPSAPSEEAGVKVDAKTAEVIQGALKYLAGQQRLDGSWSYREGLQGHAVAMTGYTLLAFMAAGNVPGEGDYAKNVSGGARFLLESLQPDGQFRGVSPGQYMYNHGIATVALAELYGETQSPGIRVKLQSAIDLILASQNPAGGWRYQPHPNDADISVTVLQAVALRAAQGAGLAIPRQAIDNAISYVDSCYQPHTGGFLYQPGKQPTGFARTAAAIYSLQVLGKYDDPRVKTGSEYLFSHLLDHGPFWSYGNYYAAPAQYMVGGDTWRRWYEQINRILLNSVQRDGDQAHWEPKFDNGSQSSALFATAVYVHILAMPYHFLPLYQR